MLLKDDIPRLNDSFRGATLETFFSESFLCTSIVLRSLASTSRECQFSSRVIFPILHSIEMRKKILLLVWNIYIAM